MPTAPADDTSAPRFLPDCGAAAARLASLEAMGREALLAEARVLRDAAHGTIVSYSPKVFIPLTRLCRDVCGYCTFAEIPRAGQAAYLSPDEVIAIARAGAQAGCTEALFTLGEMPEQRYAAARGALAELGHATTIAYLAAMAERVHRETGLLPHVNPGVMTREEMAALRRVSASQGLMLESTSPRLLERGGPHHGSIGKRPEARIAVIAEAGRQAIPFTTGILIGIGETRLERIEALMTIAALHAEYGHVQEVIVQNFLPKPGTRMAAAPAADFDELVWTAAAARLILGPAMNIQVPPNLSFARFPELLQAGINDWGGVSPVTPDHVNPEAAWPALDRLREATEAAGFDLVARLPAYPAQVREATRWFDPAIAPSIVAGSDAEGWARADSWHPGVAGRPARPIVVSGAARGIDALLTRAARGGLADPADVARLLTARGAAAGTVIAAADALRRESCGDAVTYVVNRNINYTNVCAYRCGFCAFSKGRTAEHLRGPAYDLDRGEVTRRVAEAAERGATEVCMQGGIHPRYTGRTYLDLLKAAKAGADIHVHAFSPLEITHGARTLDVSVPRFLAMLREAGLGSLPGTAAEILHDDVRAVICPDKLSTDEWLAVVGAAHEQGIPTTATILFGHVEAPHHVAWHLARIRAQQEATGGFTEFVPLPFVHMEAPIALKGRARHGPTFREAVLMHAVARLALHPVIGNVQVSWVKMGPEGAAACLAAGANDLGGTLMNESISRAAGTQHGQELAPPEMEALIRGAGRRPRQRTTLYRRPDDARRDASFAAAPLAPLVQNPAARRAGLPQRSMT